MTFTAKQQETISDNLHAYLANFETVIIERADYGGGFYVFTNESDHKAGRYIQFCYNIDYLNGWLYGAVQAVCGQLGHKKTEENRHE